MLTEVLLFTSLALGLVIAGNSDVTMELRMPGVIPPRADYYVCSSFDVKKEGYVVKYAAKADAKIVHHLLVYGCDSPVTKQAHWQCGRKCSGYQTILFAWAKNALPLELPEGVGYHIGGNSGIKSIVMQIHYAKKLEDSDYSGVDLVINPHPTKFIAGIFLMAAYTATIPPHKDTDVDLSCDYDDKEPIYPFAFRTHAHELARVITGYQVNTTQNKYHLIGSGSPQRPQAFYPTPNHLRISSGDKLLARCSYSSLDRDTTTHIGGKHTDEMCNLYIMYYTDADKGKPYQDCGGNKYPELWAHAPTVIPTPPSNTKTTKSHSKTKTTQVVNDVKSHSLNKEVVNFPFGGSSLKAIPGWPTLPDDVKLGQVAGVAVDKDNNVIVFHRGDRTWNMNSFDYITNIYNDHGRNAGPIKQDTLLKFSPKGKLLKKWGANIFYLPHGLHIDKDNNLWLTDVALHQVFKFKMDSDKEEFALGTRFKPGNGKDQFCKPTDVTVMDNGDFYVSDGYCNHRVVKFSATGVYQFEWGKVVSYPSAKDGYPQPEEFNLPHSITFVDSPHFKLLCVGDRENKRIQCFDLNGKFVVQMHPKGFRGAVYAVSYSKKNDLLYAVSGPGDGKALGATFSLKPGKQSTVVATLLETWSPDNKGFHMPHDVAASHTSDAVYVAEINPYRVWKFDTNKHKTVKKAQVPSVTNYMKPDSAMDISFKALTDETSGKKAAKSNSVKISDPPVLVAVLLIVPVVIICIITGIVKYRNKHGKDSIFKTKSSTIGGFFKRKYGFEKLNTEELDHLNSDSENEMFDATLTGKA